MNASFFDSHSPSAADKRRTYQRLYQATSDGQRPGGQKLKLTDEQIVEAKKMLGPGFKTKREVAKHFGVCRATLERALTRPPGQPMRRGLPPIAEVMEAL